MGQSMVTNSTTAALPCAHSAAVWTAPLVSRSANCGAAAAKSRARTDRKSATSSLPLCFVYQANDTQIDAAGYRDGGAHLRPSDGQLQREPLRPHPAGARRSAHSLCDG